MSSVVGQVAPVMEEYHTVKSQLDAMEYGKEFLALESLPLVKRLLSDLILTTESHEEQQKRIVELEGIAEKAQEEGFPLRRENSRLVRENNQLHLELIKRAEEFDTQEKKWKLSIKKGQDSVKDSWFASKQLVGKISALMRELENSGNKENSRSAADKDAVQLIISDLKKTLKTVTDSSAGPGVDKAATTQPASELKRLQEQLDSTKKQLQLRDEEIQRLGRQLEEGGRLNSISNDGGQQSTGKDARVITQLNEQVRFLTSQVADYEAKLENTKVDARLLVQAQRELRRKDARIKSMVLERSANQSKFVERVGSETDEPKEDSQKFAELLESYRTDKARMKQTIQELERELMETRGEYHTIKTKADSANKKSATVDQEIMVLKQQLREKAEDLKDAQNALNTLQSEKLKCTEDLATAQTKLETQKMLLEENAMELDSLRSEVDKAKRDHRELLTKSLKMKSDQDRLEGIQRKQLETERSFELKFEGLRDERNMLQNRMNRFVDDNQKLANRLRQAQADVEEFKENYEKSSGRVDGLEGEIKLLREKLLRKSEAYEKEAGARARLERLSDLPTVVRELEAQVVDLRERSTALDTELRRTTNELKLEKARSEEVGREMNNLERALGQVRKEKEEDSRVHRVLQQELEDTKLELKSTKDERDHLAKLNKESMVKLSKQAELQVNQDMAFESLRSAAERAEAITSATSQREKLLNDQLEKLRSESNQVEQQLIQLKGEFATVSKEKQRLDALVASKDRDHALREAELSQANREIKNAEARAKDLDGMLDRERQRSAQLQGHVDKLKSLLEKLDVAREGLQQKISLIHTALQKERSKSAKLEEEISLMKEGQSAAQEKARLAHKSVTELAKQKGFVESKLEEARSQRTKFEEVIKKQELKYRQLEEKLGAANRLVQTHVEALDSRDEDVKHLERKLESSQAELKSMKQTCQNRNQEISAASQDLSNMTRENQAMNAMCQTLRVERDKLRAQLGESMTRASRLDGLLESAKLEKADVLSVYRRACDENKRLKHLVQELSSSRARAVGDQQAQLSEVSRLKQKIAEKEEHLRRQRVDLEAYERQVADLSRSLHLRNAKLQTFQEDRTTAEKTAQSAKESAKSALKREESLRWEVGQAKSEIQKLTSRISRLQGENQTLNARLLEAKHKLTEMELIVARARASEAQAIMNWQEQESQLSRLREESQKRSLASVEKELEVEKEARSQSLTAFAKDSGAGSVGVKSQSEQQKSNTDSSNTNSTDFERECQELEEMIHEQSDVIKELAEEHDEITEVTDSLMRQRDNNG